MKRRFALLLALAAFCSMGAEVRTTNFIVISADPQVCQSVAQWAEHYRREKAIQWLNKEMPPWPEPCPLRVKVTMEGPSGATEFTFGPGRVNSMRMQIQGPLDRLIYSVLPHEITHTVFAYHFKMPVPRWADEGGSVLSEDDPERERHDKLVRSILNRGQQIPMRTLFNLKEYPPQVMCLYAQGFSISDYLVKRSNKQHFLNFVAAGMYYGWDNAAKSFYSHGSVEELEQAWLKYLRDTKKQPQDQIVAQTPNGKVVRMTVPPVQPFDPQPVFRGAMPSQEQSGQRSAQINWQPSVQLQAPVPIMSQNPNQPNYTPTSGAQSVQLGAPVVIPRYEPSSASAPIGFPRP
jgi:hypothetical protein